MEASAAVAAANFLASAATLGVDACDNTVAATTVAATTVAVTNAVITTTHTPLTPATAAAYSFDSPEGSA